MTVGILTPTPKCSWPAGPRAGAWSQGSPVGAGEGPQGPLCRWEQRPAGEAVGTWGTGQTKAVSRRSLSPLPSVFGHISFRSDWELVKVDFRPWFSRQCSEEDYSSWNLTNLQVGLAAGQGWAPCRAPSAKFPVLRDRGPPSDAQSFFAVFRPPLGPGAAWARVCSHTQGNRRTGPQPAWRQACSGSRRFQIEGR